MNTVHTNLCPVCSGKDFQPYLTCTDYLVTSESFSICKCPNCNFAFTQDFPSEEVIGKYYEADQYISHTDTNEGIINKLYHKARKIALKSKTKLIRKYSSVETGTLLDIGCGTGYFMRNVCNKKWIVTGIEKSAQVREYAHEKFGLNIQDSEYLFEIPDKTKNIITMWHVLEHIEKLNATMENLHRVLKDNGTVFIALPNKESVDARYYKKNWAAYDVPRHLWHFSPKDLETFAAKHNFRVEKIKPMYFDPFYIAMLSEKNKGTSAASIVGLIKGSLFFMRSLFSTKQCSSIIYILKKQNN
jgi:2-polyprenyl-3-methyl-5-hydroxy-6-metoxy-1,4-benzoquinol methylase